MDRQDTVKRGDGVVERETPIRGGVALVGAGPGDPELITVKGLRLLREADVVVYGDLPGSAQLREARADAELIHVGASDGQRARTQREINQLLVDRAQAGKRVVRLLEGDPFAFGTGSEEAEALAEAGVDWEVAAGVAGALAAPTYAGIPVTHTDLAASLAVVNDRQHHAKRTSARDWSTVAAGADTVIILTETGSVADITEQLVRGGRAPTTPAAVVSNGTTPRQVTVAGTLEDIAGRVQVTDATSPAALVVGEVVGLRDHLRWFDTRPLIGRRIVITRASEQAPALMERLERQGAEVMALAMIGFAPPDDYAPLDAAIGELDAYDWVLFTSVNGVRAFARRLWEQGKDWRAVHRARVGAIGPGTARELEAWHVRPDFVPSEYVAEGMLAEIGNVAGQRILLPRTDIARATLATELHVRGAEVREVVAYRTLTQPPDPETLRRVLVERRPDAITFTSSSTVRGFVEAIASGGLGEPADALRGVAIACIGPITAETVRSYGMVPTIAADEYTMDGLTDALVRHFSGLPRNSKE